MAEDDKTIVWLAVFDYPSEADMIPNIYGVYATPEEARQGIDDMLALWNMDREPWSHEEVEDHHNKFFYCKLTSTPKSKPICLEYETAYVSYTYRR